MEVHESTPVAELHHLCCPLAACAVATSSVTTHSHDRDHQTSGNGRGWSKHNNCMGKLTLRLPFLRCPLPSQYNTSVYGTPLSRQHVRRVLPSFNTSIWIPANWLQQCLGCMPSTACNAQQHWANGVIIWESPQCWQFRFNSWCLTWDWG